MHARPARGRISRDVAAVAREGATGGTVVVDPFVGSGNTLVWLARRLKSRVAVGFELDEAVAATAQRNVALLELPIEVRHERSTRPAGTTDFSSGHGDGHREQIRQPSRADSRLEVDQSP